MKGCVTCASHMDQGDCESMGCTWQEEKCYYSMPEKEEKGDCEMEGMCCPENYECRMNRGATKKACVADNDAEIIAVKCGNPCKGQMSMMDEKCMRAETKEECVKMTASPMSTKPICKYT